MNAKGTIYGVAKNSITAAFGEERWDSFMNKLAEKDNYFSKMIMTITLIPAEKLIFLFDEMCKEFFNNDKMQYEIFGKIGAKIALSPDGPYKSYMLTKDIKPFVEIVLPKLWATYFDKGIITSRLENNVVHLNITGLKVAYIYFEYLLMGYFQQSLKVFGRKSIAKRVKGLASGDGEIYFQYELKNP